MFAKIKKTTYPPSKKPMLVWDGECGFCGYWVTRWKCKTKGAIDFNTYQEVSKDYPDIPEKEFKKASRLIDTEGIIYSGPDSAYKSLSYSSKQLLPFHKWYRNYSFFTWLSDHAYNFIAKNRSFFFKITKICFGSDPLRPKSYWQGYLLIFFGILIVIVFFITKF